MPVPVSVVINPMLPAAHSWKLYYPVGDDQMLQRYRLHFEMFRNDPHVENVECYDLDNLPNNAVLYVQFKGAWTEPEQKELHHLHLVYAQPRAAQPHALRMRTTAPVREPPTWIQEGAWVQNSKMDLFKVVQVSYSVGDFPIVELQEYGTDARISLLLDALVVSFKGAPAPKEPLTAHQRLMGDDEY